MEREMTSKDVVNLYIELENMGIKIWIDGGWAVDALLHEQTRLHEDLDIAIERKDVMELKKYLEGQGYGEIQRDKDKKWDLVLADNRGQEIEVHSFTYNSNGQIIEDEHWDGYSGDSLSGMGIINGQAVRCVSLAQIIKTHDNQKRKFKETDYKDMSALSQKFGI